MAHDCPHPGPLPQAGEGEKPATPAAITRVRETAVQAQPVQTAAGSASLSRERERAGVRGQNARQLRAQGTDAEQTLWRCLRARQLNGHKFRRQHPIGPYIADFACVEARWVIELDGGQHAWEEAQLYDGHRTRFLQSQGWQVLRFWNHDVLTQIAGVLQAIAQALGHPHPHPLPPAGEGASQKGQ